MRNLPAAGTYSIDNGHSHVGFGVKHFGLAKVKGEFTEFSGTVTIADDPTASSVEVTIAASSDAEGRQCVARPRARKAPPPTRAPVQP